MLRRRAHRDRIIVKEKDKQRRIKDSHHKESEVADVKHVVEKRVEGSSHSGGVPRRFQFARITVPSRECRHRSVPAPKPVREKREISKR